MTNKVSIEDKLERKIYWCLSHTTDFHRFIWLTGLLLFSLQTFRVSMNMEFLAKVFEKWSSLIILNVWSVNVGLSWKPPETFAKASGRFPADFR